MITRDPYYGIGYHTIKLVQFLTRSFPDLTIHTFFGLTNYNTNRLTEKLKQKYDLIHIQGTCWGAGKNSKINKKTPRILTVHSLLKTELKYEKNPAFLLGLPFEKKTIKKADKIIVVNQILVEELTQNYRVPPEKITVIPNAVDVTEFDNVSVQRENPPFIMSCGRKIKRKDFPTLIKACKKIGFPLKLFHGELSRLELIKQYKKALMFVCPSLYETGPITVLEAMASRTPVICSNIPAVKNVVYDRFNGILFNPGDPDDLSEKILYLYHNFYPEGTRYAENAYNFVKEHYNWFKVAEETYRTYLELTLK